MPETSEVHAHAVLGFFVPVLANAVIELQGFFRQFLTAAADGDFGNNAGLEDIHGVFDGSGFTLFTGAEEVENNRANGLAFAAIVHQCAGGSIDVLGGGKDVKVGAANRSAAAITARGGHRHADAKAVIGNFDGAAASCVLYRHRAGFAFDSRLYGVVVKY